MLEEKTKGKLVNQNKDIVLHKNYATQPIEGTRENQRWLEEKQKYEKEVSELKKSNEEID